MHRASDTFSLTDFKANAKDHLERIRATGRPEVLTVNGRAEAVLLTPEAYDLRADLAGEPLRFWAVHSILIVYRPDTKPLQVIRVLHGAPDVAVLLGGPG